MEPKVEQMKLIFSIISLAKLIQNTKQLGADQKIEVCYKFNFC